MPLTDQEWTRLGQLIDARLTAARAGIADEVAHRYQVHVGDHLEATTDAVGQILAAVTGLTPASVAAAVRAAFPAGLTTTGGAPVDVDQLAAAVAAHVDVRAQVADVLLRGAQPR